MPNELNENGLTTATQTELVTNYTAAFEGIYGPNIDLSSSSPDGQAMMAGTVQPTLDMEDLAADVYSSMDPDQAVGRSLDMRVGINGIQRQGGTPTITPVTVTVNRALNLFGLDQQANAPFTVADAAGNQWILQTTQHIGAAGSYSFLFQAALPGALTTVPNTINVPVTIVVGVTAVNNPSLFSTKGTDEETDADLRIRRQAAVQISSVGFKTPLEVALGNITGVTFAKVFENKTDSVDVNGTPGHCLWAIVAGTGAPASIAKAIYGQRGAGCNMRGVQFFNVPEPDGNSQTIQWVDVTPETLFIKFTATSIDGINPPKIAQILTNLPTIFVPGVAQEVNATLLGTAVQQIDPNTLVQNAGFSTSAHGTFTPTLTPQALNFQFVVLTQNIYVTPVVLLPQSSSVIRSTSQQFNAYGGTQTGYTFSMLVNNSGGGINSVTGLYTAGATPGTDTVRVVDGDGNTATATVVVT